MDQRRFFNLKEVKYFPSSDSPSLLRRNSFIIAGDEQKHVVTTPPLGKGTLGEVNTIAETKLLRKKGVLENISSFLEIDRELSFHKLYYGEDSIIVKYFSDGIEIQIDAIQEKLAAGREVTYRLIRENIEGDTLEEVLNTYIKDPEKTLYLYLQTAKALLSLHQIGIIHGDCNGRNFIVSKNFKVFPIDFGKSYWMGGKAVTTTQICQYWSPERMTTGHDLVLMFNKNGQLNQLKEKEIQFNCTDNGLQLRFFGLDKQEERETIFWIQLKDFPQTNEGILAKKEELLPRLFRKIVAADYSQDIYSYGHRALRRGKLKERLAQFPEIIRLFERMVSERSSQRPKLTEIISTLEIHHKKFFLDSGDRKKVSEPEKVDSDQKFQPATNIIDSYSNSCISYEILMGVAMFGGGIALLIFLPYLLPPALSTLSLKIATGAPLLVTGIGLFAYGCYKNYTHLPEPAALPSLSPR